MATGSVVLTPGSAYAVPGALDLSAEALADSEWTARVALGIAAASSDLAPPLLLVLTGHAAAHAPHLGFAQRSARRAVSGYVLVDPVLPRPGAVSDWPDAPVTVILTPQADDDTRAAALGARLRGWEVLEGDPSSLIADIAARP
ncbi:MAG: hypothetical protein RL134_435 [Actinomycetota bacterium]